MALVGAALEQQDIDRVLKKLRDFPERLQKQILRPALRAAANHMLANMKGRMARMQDTGTMLESAHVRAIRPRKHRVGVQVVVDARTSDKPGGASSGATHKNFPYPYMVEFGHKVGKRPKSIKRLHDMRSKAKTKGNLATVASITEQLAVEDVRRDVPPAPFMRPAADESRPAVRLILRMYVDQGIAKAIDAVKR